MADTRTKAQRVEDLHARNLSMAWEAMLSHEAGRLVLWSILDRAGVSKVGAGMFLHFGGDSDILLKGRQQLGAELLDEFVHANNPEAYYTMLQEADDRDEVMSSAILADQTEDEQEGQP